MYASYKALITKTTKDDTSWLAYWVIFSLMLTASHFLSFLPFVVETLSIMSIYLQRNKESRLKICKKYCFPFFHKYEPLIDRELNKINQDFSGYFLDCVVLVKDYIKQFIQGQDNSNNGSPKHPKIKKLFHTKSN